MPIKMERSVSDTKFGEKGMEFEGHSQTDPELMEPRKESYKKGRILSEMPADKQPNSEGNEENELIEQVYRMHSVEEKNPREIAKALNVSAREVRDIIYMHSKSGM